MSSIYWPRPVRKRTSSRRRSDWPRNATLRRCRVRAAHESARQGPCRFAVAIYRYARYDRRHVAIGALYQPTSTSWQVVRDLGRPQLQPSIIDNVDVSLITAVKHATIAQPDGLGGIARQAPDRPG